MLLRRVTGIILAGWLITGCQTLPQHGSEQRTETDGNQAAVVDATADQTPLTPSAGSAPTTVPTTASTTAPTTATATQTLNYLSAQLTALQEQVIQLKANSDQLTLFNQRILAELQRLHQQPVPVAGQESTQAALVSERPDSRQVDQLSNQITQLQQTLSSPFRLVASYTAKGQWVLIRYHQVTGQSWLADQGRWNALQEQQAPDASTYRILLLRADNDAKGFAAARIDQQSGAVWWLNQNRWLRF